MLLATLPLLLVAPQQAAGSQGTPSAAVEVLVSIAELRLGVGTFTYQIDEAGRRRVPSYSSPVCPIRGKTRVEALLASGHADVVREAETLVPLADRDESGSVTQAEAKELASILDFGFRAGVAAREAGYQAEATARIMNLPALELRMRLVEYEAIARRGLRLGLSVPLPPELVP